MQILASELDLSFRFLAVGLLRSSISLGRALQVDGRRFAKSTWLAPTQQRTLSERHRDSKIACDPGYRAEVAGNR
jgi:hypothetical protein